MDFINIVQFKNAYNLLSSFVQWCHLGCILTNTLCVVRA